MHDIQNEETRQVRIQLLAVRMSWLKWLCTPIRLIWFVTGETARAFWRLVMIAGSGIRAGYHKEVLKKSIMGGSVFFAVLLVSAYLGFLANAPVIAGVGVALGFLPLAWTFGEATAAAKAREEKDSNSEPFWIDRKTGMKTAIHGALDAVIIALLLAIQALLSLTTTIPGLGLVFLGLIMVPNLAISVLVILTAVLLCFSIAVLPSQLVAHVDVNVDRDPVRHFGSVNRQMLSTLKTRSYWLQVLFIAPAGIIMALLASIPMLILVFSGLSMSLGVSGMVLQFAHAGENPLGAIASLVPGSFFNPEMLSITAKAGIFLCVIALSVVLGLAFSPFWSGLASMYYKLYQKRDEGKTWPLVCLLVISTLLTIGAVFLAKSLM